jgi:hypothetical protein
LFYLSVSVKPATPFISVMIVFFYQFAEVKEKGVGETERSGGAMAGAVWLDGGEKSNRVAGEASAPREPRV